MFILGSAAQSERAQREDFPGCRDGGKVALDDLGHIRHGLAHGKGKRVLGFQDRYVLRRHACKRDPGLADLGQKIPTRARVLAGLDDGFFRPCGRRSPSRATAFASATLGSHCC